MDSQTLFITYIGEVEHHRHAVERSARLTDDGTASRDDDLGEMVVEWYTGFTETQRRFAIYDEGGQSGDVQQPILRRNPVVGVASPNADVGHFELRFLCSIDGSTLSLA